MIVSFFSYAQSQPLNYPPSLNPLLDPAPERVENIQEEEEEPPFIPGYQLFLLPNGNQVLRVFQNGRLSQTELLTTESDIYIGELDAEWRPHGHGTMEYANGDTYTGEWVDGQRANIIWDSPETITNNNNLTDEPSTPCWDY